MIDNVVYQRIFDSISSFLPDDWKKVIIYLEYGEASYEFFFYVLIDDCFVKCYELSGVNDDDLYDAFDAIDEYLSAARDELPESKWSNMTMVVTNTGEMHVDFDYTDLTECGYEYSKSWKEKYLR